MYKEEKKKILNYQQLLLQLLIELILELDFKENHNKFLMSLLDINMEKLLYGRIMNIKVFRYSMIMKLFQLSVFLKE